MNRIPVVWINANVLFGLGLTVAVSVTLNGLSTAPGKAQNETIRARNEQNKISYPPSKTIEHVDVYHDVKIADPYRWLEDLDSKETKQWIGAQNELTFSYLRQIPVREQIRDRLEELWNYQRYGLPEKAGSRYFYTRNDGLQNQSVLYVAESLTDSPRLLLDPNKLSEDGTVALANWVPSNDGNYIAYGLATSGSDWREWYVMDVNTGQPMPDHLRWVKFSSVSWTPDNKGFYYSRYDEPAEGEKLTESNYYQKLYFHELGDSQQDDRLVYQRPDQKEWGFDGEVTEDGSYLIISVWRGTDQENQIFYRDLKTPNSRVIELLAGFDAEYIFLGNDGERFWVRTNRSAPRNRVVEIDLKNAQPSEWTELIPESPHVLQAVNVVGDQFFARYLQDATTRVRKFGLDGRARGELDLPGIGTAGGFGGRRDDDVTFYYFTNATTPVTIYRHDMPSGQSRVFRQPEVDFHPDDFVTRQVFFRSLDGTRVPMFIIHKKALDIRGATPTILYGYGGFNISLTPAFVVKNLVWMEMGGIYAVANLRGGGEYGREWHEAGMLDNKQNVFDDFASAARWLIDNGYTNSDHLAIHGRSNGGLLVGATLNQNPELFAAAIPGVGVMDMLRFHKFTIGWAWVSEYGSSDDAEQFQTLREYSPLHNIRQGAAYPATLITTSDHDDRVVPSHSFKYAAALQAAQGGDSPVLIRIETSAGHGAGTPTSKRIAAATDELAFLAHELKMQAPTP